MSLEAAEVVEEPQVEIAAVHHQMLLLQPRPEGLQLDGRQGVDEEHVPIDEKLQQADPHPVAVHVVRLGIEGDLFDLVEGIQQRLQLPGWSIK